MVGYDTLILLEVHNLTWNTYNNPEWLHMKSVSPDLFLVQNWNNNINYHFKISILNANSRTTQYIPFQIPILHDKNSRLTLW